MKICGQGPSTFITNLKGHTTYCPKFLYFRTFMYTTKVMSDVMKSGPTYVGTKCPYCTYNLFGQVFMYESYVRESAEGEVGLYILCIYIVRTSCAAGLSGWTERGLYVRVARACCAQIFWNVGIYCIYIIYVQVVRKRVYVARPVRRKGAERYVRYILYIYIICTSCTYKCTPRIPFCVMRCAHT